MMRSTGPTAIRIEPHLSAVNPYPSQDPTPNVLARSAARNRPRRTHRRPRRECPEHQHERGEPNERVHERDARLQTDGERDRLAHCDGAVERIRDEHLLRSTAARYRDRG